jgi:AsmA family/AsmA-like C-terminal region
MKTGRYRRFAFWALLILLAAWLLPSLLSAERFRHRLEARLELALGRSVRLGAISPQLLPRPGFSVENVTVREDPAFGSEPFARVDRVDCSVALWSLLHGRIEIGRLRLESATINLVRNPGDHWNVERITSAGAPVAAGRRPPAFSVELQDARLNFKEGPDKRPFAVTGLDGRVTVDRGRGAVSFDVSGTPVRTDLGLPSPGRLSLSGTWKPRGGGDLDVTLRTRGALLYDWIPLATGRNPGIYGVLDAEAHVYGPLSLLMIDAQLHLSQVRRWESLPPAGDLPVNVSVKAALDRAPASVRFEQVAVEFGKSRVQVAGTIVKPGSQASLDLTASGTALRLEDFGGLAARLFSRPASLAVLEGTGVTGLAHGQIAIQGPWAEPRFSGSVNTRSAHLVVRGVSLPLSDTAIRAGGRRIDLGPTHIIVSPELTISAEGALQFNAADLAPAPSDGAPHSARKRSAIRAATSPPGYQLMLSARSATAQTLVDFARNLGFAAARDLDARGTVNAILAVAGSGWPPAGPVLSGMADLRNAEIGLPGLSRPLEIQEARVQLNGDHVSINPASFSIGASELTGRIEHSGARDKPWTFDLRAGGPQGSLDLGQAASWFEALGHRPPLDWLARIPGLGTLAARRAAGTTLFNALNVRGEFSTPVMTYRNLNFRGFHATVEIRQRVIHVNSATFRMSTGHARAEATADLRGAVPRLSADFSVSGLRVENWASHLPPQLGEVRGSAALQGQLSAQGTAQAELESTLQGRGELDLAGLDLGRFDPLRDAAHAASWGDLAPSRGPVTLRAATLDLEVRGQHLIVKPARFEFAGAAFELSGTCAFDRSAQFESTADLRHVNRRWLEDSNTQGSRVTRFLLTGPLDALNATRENEAAVAPPARP